MPDQLTLRLDASLPRLPDAIRPMMALPAPAPFDSADHLFEPSWGGTRALAFVEVTAGATGPSLRLMDESGRDVAPFLPELASLAARLNGENIVLDGELVLVNRLGRMDRLALANRLRGKPGPAVAYLAFDLLYLNGRPLFSQPLTRRRDLLRRTLRPGDDALAVPAIATEGRALFDAVVEAGIGGVMARERRSPYLPGVRSRLWRFVAPGDASAVSAASPDGGLDDDPDTTAEGDAHDRASGPVLSLIRRLPLPLDDAE